MAHTETDHRCRSVEEIAERMERRAEIDAAEKARFEAATAPVRRARKKLRAGGRTDDKASATPTAERLARADEHYRQDAVRAYHCEDAPVERLAKRRALDPDPGRNEMMRQAASRYYEHWYLSGMSGVSAIDLTRASASSESRPVGMPATEAALAHRRKYRDARAKLAEYGGDRLLDVVEFVVLNECVVEAIAVQVSGYRDRGKAIAVTLDRLRGGLGLLAVHFRIGRLDAVRTTMPPLRHESELRPDGGEAGDGGSRVLQRHRSLAGM